MAYEVKLDISSCRFSPGYQQLCITNKLNQVISDLKGQYPILAPAKINSLNTELTRLKENIFRDQASHGG